MSAKQDLRPKVPDDLSKESIVMWVAWYNKKDKEIVREAATKCTYIDLAIRFLSARNRIDLTHSEVWFRKEIHKWIVELLERQQFVRATFIFTNMKMDPNAELSRIVYVTNSRPIRDSTADYLVKSNKLDVHHKNLWTFMKLYLTHQLYKKYDVSIPNLETLDQQCIVWRSKVATELFIRTENVSLLYLLDSEEFWKNLIKSEHFHYILNWINLQYNPDYKSNLDKNIVDCLKSFPITNEMINWPNENAKSKRVKNAIYDEFAKYGIFCEDEKEDFSTILERLLGQTNNIDEILSKNSSNLSIDQYKRSLIEFCLRNKFYTVMSCCLDGYTIPAIDRVPGAKHLELLGNFRKLTFNFDLHTLRENIFKVILLLSGNYLDYLEDNPLILLALLLFTKDSVLTNFLENNPLIIGDYVIKKDIINNVIQTFPLLQEICDKYRNCLIINQLTIYDLMEKHANFNVKQLFPFRYDRSFYPNFSSIESPYKKKINHLIYLRQSRPCMALKMYDSNKFPLKTTVGKIIKLALNNFDCKNITASAIAFLEMLEINTKTLRIDVASASMIHESGHEHSYVVNLFYTTEKRHYLIQDLLELAVINSVDFDMLKDGEQLIRAFKNYDILMEYTRMNNLKYPERFLIHCASRNYWLIFLMISQIYKYPLDQVRLLVKYFKSPNLLEHIDHSVANEFKVDENEAINDMLRAYLIMKIGVKKPADTYIHPDGSISSWASSFSGDCSLDKFEIDLSNRKATLLQTLIRCHNSTDPPKALLQACQLYKNPLLAIFATAYEPDSVLTSWLTWLAVSCELYESFENYELVSTDPDFVQNLLEKCMRHRFHLALNESFEIFLPDNPLKLFLNFLDRLIKLETDLSILLPILDEFGELLNDLKSGTAINDITHETVFLSQRNWIESTAIYLLAAVLNDNCDSLYQQISLLEVLCKIPFENYIIHAEYPSLENLLEILENIHESQSGIRLDINPLFKDLSDRRSVIECMNELTKRNCYKMALNIARIENLPLDIIIVRQWECKFSSAQNNSRTAEFWNACNGNLLENEVTVDYVLDFYLQCLNRMVCNEEKYVVSRLLYDWSVRFNLEKRDEFETKMWLSYINLESDKKKIYQPEKEYPNALYKELSILLENVPVYKGVIPEETDSLIEKIISTALDETNLWLALKLEKMFNHNCKSLNSLKLSYSLAEGLLLPENLSDQQRQSIPDLGTLRYNQRWKSPLSFKFPNKISSNSSYYVHPDLAETDILTILQILTNNLNYGKKLGQQIVMTYRLSLNTDNTYDTIVKSNNRLELLKDSLEADCPNKLDVVHDFAMIDNWSSSQIADFICGELTHVISEFVASDLEGVYMWNLNLDKDFQLILQLLPNNCAELGHQIYSYASTLYKTEKMRGFDKNQETCLKEIIELFIRCHDCFTADCDMEGISLILKKSQDIIANLVALQNWKSIVRLLTGIGRYNEMTYVFNILQENDHFEFLLRKDTQKSPALKAALLDYLKKYCPENRDLYKIVALHFTLFSEVAIIWEDEAQKIITNLISISKLEMQNNKLNLDEEIFVLLTHTEGTLRCLKKSMENYTHATEFHLQSERFVKAMSCAKQAQLLALQLNMLKFSPINATTPCILNMDQKQMVVLLWKHISLEQALIVIEAYTNCVDWGTILYERCIVDGDMKYFENYLQHLPLTDQIVHEMSRKFVRTPKHTKHQYNCMEKILDHLPSVHLKYKLASQLGFSGLTEKLIDSDQVVYLKDTVWKKGYTNNEPV